jgi:hypothetical protein
MGTVGITTANVATTLSMGSGSTLQFTTGNGNITVPDGIDWTASITDGYLQSFVADGIRSVIAGGIEINAINGLNLSSGFGEDIQYSPAITTNLISMIVPSSLPANWAMASYEFYNGGAPPLPSLQSTASNNTNPVCIPFKIKTKSTINSVTVCFTVSNTYSGLPSSIGTIQLYKAFFNGVNDDAPTFSAMSSAVPISTASTAAGYEADNFPQYVTVTCTGNNTNIGTGTSTYYAVLYDSSGTNSLSGTYFHTISTNLTVGTVPTGLGY